MFDIGMQEIIVIIIVALLVFGPNRLPELSRTIGKGLSQFRRAVEDAKERVESELKEEENLKENLKISEEIKDEEKSLYKDKPEEHGEAPAKDIYSGIEEKKDSEQT